MRCINVTRVGAPSKRRRGSALLYTVIAFTGICAVSSLGIDYARANYLQKELYAAAEATANYAASGTADGTAVAKAVAYSKTLYVNGSNFALQSSDVQVGIWDSSTSAFTATSSSPNAIWVSYQQSAARGTSLGSIFMLNRSIDVHGSVIVTYTAGVNTVINVPGGACPWLAGMPSGTTANFTNQGWTDQAPANSPVAASGLNISSGAIVQFGFTGAVSYYPGTQPFDPDGNPSWIINDYYAGQNGGAEHGIADLNAPLTSVIGVFLDASQPDSTRRAVLARFLLRQQPRLFNAFAAAQTAFFHRERIPCRRGDAPEFRGPHRRHAPLHRRHGRSAMERQLRLALNHRHQARDRENRSLSTPSLNLRTTAFRTIVSVLRQMRGIRRAR